MGALKRKEQNFADCPTLKEEYNGEFREK